MAYFAASAKNVSTVTTGTVKSDRVVLVTVNTGAAGAILRIYDGTTSAGTLIATIDASSKGTLTYMVRTSTHNLFYDLSVGAADVTIVFD